MFKAIKIKTLNLHSLFAPLKMKNKVNIQAPTYNYRKGIWKRQMAVPY